MQDIYQRPDSYIPRDVSRALSVVSELIPSGSFATLEGTPLYAGIPWGPPHEFGMNVLLPAMHDLLIQRACSTTHVALIDDFTTGQFEDAQNFTLQMRLPPQIIFYESQFAETAEEALRYLETNGKTFSRNGEMLLRTGSIPRVRVRSGRVSCELLDACFQRKKMGDFHIIFHPTEFINQQQGMREVLSAINSGSLPAVFINAFFKNNSMSRILVTDCYGRTNRINY